ncbi:FadR/GntR family transcriptional regulator [Marinobacterium rhizophilum]|uniref:FadR/GntR family transcriptional regulator n=1 Tax=Marinobacterium rhizophilum TaxID=420402 RepID=UPI0003759AF3|nr:FadR/GntR family transcriptional regulator [Marinobacterium rhizophilum]
MNPPPAASPSAPDETQRKRPRKLAQTLVNELTRQISEGLIQLGDKLPTESAIMAQQSVSRTVVREALQRLQAAGLVETRHGVGTFVIAKPNEGKSLPDVVVDSVQDAVAILELRLSLEIETAGLAAERRTEAQLNAIREALKTLQECEARDDQAAANADLQFHLRIAEATGNHYFIDIMNHLKDTLVPRKRMQSERVNHEHEEVVAAIARRDSYAARAAMRLHLTNSRERFLSLNNDHRGA